MNELDSVDWRIGVGVAFAGSAADERDRDT